MISLRYEYVIVAVILFASMMTYVGLATASDISQFLLVEALYNRGTFKICELPDCQGRENIVDTALYQNKTLFSDRAPGTAVLYLPVAPLAFKTKSPPFVFSILSAIFVSLTCVFIYKISKHFGADDFTSTATGLLFGLATIMWKYSATMFSHPVSSLMVTYVTWAVLTKRTNILTYAVLGYLPLVEYANALLSVIFFAYLFLTKDLKWHYIIISAIPGLLLMYHNDYYFGNPFTMSYNFSVNHPWVATLEAWDGNWFEGLTGFIIGNDKLEGGLFLMSPFLLFGLIGLIIHPDKRKYLLVALFFAHFLLYAKYRQYFGGGVADTRYLLSVIPQLVIPVSFTLTQFKNIKVVEIIFWLLVAFSISQVMLDIALFNGHCATTPEVVKWPPTNMDAIKQFVKCFWVI